MDQKLNNEIAQVVPSPPRVLVVDDDIHFLKLVQRVLQKHGITVVTGRSADEAREEIAKQKPELIISDMMMPGMKGDEFCRELQADNETADIPFIFVSAVRDPETRIQSFDAGAIDYLVKPVFMDELAAKVLAMVRKSRTTRIIMLTDALTGAKNRWYFEEELPRLILQAKRGDWPLTLVVVDINDFKQLNDKHSHSFGDQVLSIVSTTLKRAFRTSDVVIRYGGDEFVIALPETGLRESLIPIQRLFKLFSTFFCVDDAGVEVPVRISAGVAAFPQHGGDLEEVFNAADQALYKVKKEKTNGFAYAGEDNVRSF